MATKEVKRISKTGVQAWVLVENYPVRNNQTSFYRRIYATI
jgi:hypothetical protein